MAIQQVRAQVNGVWHVLTWNGATSKYEATITSPTTTSFNLAGGYYPATVEVTNTASTVVTADHNHATLGAGLRLVVKETVIPTISVTSPGSGATVNNARPPISFQLRDAAGGSGVKISSLKLQIDSGAIVGNTDSGMVVAAVSGGFDVTYTPPTAISQGAHTVKIDIDDNDGNKATQATRAFTVDTIAPTLNVTAPSNNFITNSPNINVVGTTNEATSSPVTVTVRRNTVDQGAVSVVAGSFTKAITLVEGANTIVVRSTDSSGLFTEVTITVTLDTSIPSITSVTITPNPANTGQNVLISVAVTG